MEVTNRPEPRSRFVLESTVVPWGNSLGDLVTAVAPGLHGGFLHGLGGYLEVRLPQVLDVCEMCLAEILRVLKAGDLLSSCVFLSVQKGSQFPGSCGSALFARTVGAPNGSPKSLRSSLHRFSDSSVVLGAQACDES